MKNQDDFLDKSRQQLDDSIEHLDANTLSRLNQARQAALATQSKTADTHRWLPASVAVALSIALIGSWLINSGDPQTPMVQSQAIEDLELLGSSTDLELLEDLDFISWLVVEENAG